MCAGVLVARGLGADRYGDYQFLLAGVASLTQFLDLGTSQAFFTFMSRARRGARFLATYAAWLAIQFTLVIVALGLVAPASLIQRVWLGQSRGALLLAFVA